MRRRRLSRTGTSFDRDGYRTGRAEAAVLYGTGMIRNHSWMALSAAMDSYLPLARSWSNRRAYVLVHRVGAHVLADSN